MGVPQASNAWAWQRSHTAVLADPRQRRCSQLLDTASSDQRDVLVASRSAIKKWKCGGWDKMSKCVYGKTYPFLSDVMENPCLVYHSQGHSIN